MPDCRTKLAGQWAICESNRCYCHGMQEHTLKYPRQLSYRTLIVGSEREITTVPAVLGLIGWINPENGIHYKP